MSKKNEQDQMKAPEGCTGTAIIEGNEYEIGKNGVVKVINPDHIPILERHGFVRHYGTTEDLKLALDDIGDDKAGLVKFIEERGGDADVSMSKKKLRRLAEESIEE